jgi:hypothetical protein
MKHSRSIVPALFFFTKIYPAHPHYPFEASFPAKRGAYLQSPI